jgi:ABC-type branched-subunit amino acid transport system permease subunit/ABC-type branched-subunit amino acid transport system ATPase component
VLATAVVSQTTLVFVLLGLATGALTGLVALGVVLVYRVSGVLNFAAGALGAIGAFVCYSLRDQHHLPSWLALGVGLVVGAALGAATYAVMAVARTASLLTKLIASLALLSAAEGVMLLVWGSGVNQPNSLLPTTPVAPIGHIRVGEDRLILILLVCGLAVVLRVVYSKTIFGLATSAVAENRRVAASAGWSTGSIEIVNFTVAGLLSALAAILLAPIVTLSAAVLSLSILGALAAALVGRFSSFGLAVAAALAIGVINSEVSLFQSDIASAFHVSAQSLTGLPSVAPLVVILLFTVISGRNRPVRGETLLRLPAPGGGHVSFVPLLLGLIAGGLLLARAHTWGDAFIITSCTAIIVCSVVVLSGYAGQLSLGQYALAGLAAWVAGRFASKGMPFGLAVVIGVAVTVAAGVVVALPALRTRGITLAVATLAMALVINALVFTNSSLTGGLFGISVPSPKLLGFDIDAVNHPQRYGALVLIALVVVGLVVANVRRGRIGRRMLAVRSNERAAAALGVSVTGVKLYAFGLAAGIAALGGILLAFRHPSVEFGDFDVFGSILLVQYAVIGGVGWVSGAGAGAVLAPGGLGTHLVNQAASGVHNIAAWLTVVGSIGVIILIRQAPDGVAALVSRGPMGRLAAPLGVRRKQSSSVHLDVSQTRPPARLDVDNVTVRFGGVLAVDGVSFSVSPGEVVGLIGPNGAGKTTLLDVITGFTRPDHGTVRLDEADATRWSPERRARSGLSRSWQAVELFEEMTVRENLLVGCDQHEWSRFLTDLMRPGRQPFTKIAQQVIDDFNLGDVLDELPTSLSQGHARLAGIARAIVGAPRRLLK